MADHDPLIMHIHTLGPPEVRLGEHLVTFPTRKTLALLVYLVVEERYPASRAPGSFTMA